MNARNKNALCLSTALFLAFASCLSAKALSFVNFDATYDYGDLDASQQVMFKATIDATLSFYHATLMTPNPLTVNVEFKSDNSVGLGQSATFDNSISYSDFRAGLVANANSAVDSTVLSNLPGGNVAPVNGATDVSSSIVLLRALGYADAGSNGGGFDSTVSIKTSIVNFLRTGPQDPLKYDLRQIVSHELDEVLGDSSGVSNTFGAAIGSVDVFRYNGVGSRSFTTDPNEKSYLSIDGGITPLAMFNQDAGGDYGDYNGIPPSVQDAFSTPGLQLDLGVAELTTLDAIGYTIQPGAFSAVPEPSTYGLMACLALGGLAMYKRRRTSRVA